jgi:hypothetical protein
MKMPGGRKNPLGRLIWSLSSGSALTPENAPPIALRPGALTLLTYYHDDDCPQLSGGACRCDPDIALREITQQDIAAPEDPA